MARERQKVGSKERINLMCIAFRLHWRKKRFVSRTLFKIGVEHFHLQCIRVASEMQWNFKVFAERLRRDPIALERGRGPGAQWAALI